MEFGKVARDQLDKIDFALPPTDLRTRETLNRDAARELRLGIGAPAWGVKDWLGKVYPRGTDASDFLEIYARQFTSIELNSTHYRVPDPKTVKKWVEITKPGFRFCPKFPQDISHRSPLGGEFLARFVEACLGLGDRLGTTFLQLPPHFEPEDIPDLDRFLATLPRELPICVEVRHPAFFGRHQLLTRYFDVLARRDAGAVITDVAGRRDVLHASLPSPRAMVRLILNDGHASDKLRLAAWADRLDAWIRGGLRNIEFFVHQPTDLNVPDAITALINDLNSKGLSLPKWTPQTKGEQLDWF